MIAYHFESMRSRNLTRRSLPSLAIALAGLLCTVAQGQTVAKNVSDVVEAGKLKDGVYSNSYFGITITAPAAKFTTPSLVNEPGHRGIYSTFLKGYVASLEVQARDHERIQQVLSSAVKLALLK